MDCIIGIDGGGTKTLLRVVDGDKNVICELLGDGINRYSMPADFVRANLAGLMDNALSLVPGARVLAICLGTAGAVNERDKSFYREILLAYSDRIEIYDDAYVMLFANLRNSPGIVFTCGTGSIFYGKGNNGEIARVGGWGHMMSDEGSGYEIGLAALKAAAKSYDLQKEPTKLMELLLESFDCNDFFELIDKVHTQNHNKKQIAMLAAQVDRAAHMADMSAAGILTNSAMQLCDMCGILINRLSLDSASFLVMVNGGVIQKSAFVREIFDAEMKKKHPMCTVRDVCMDSVWGAIEIAFGLLERRVSPPTFIT